MFYFSSNVITEQQEDTTEVVKVIETTLSDTPIIIDHLTCTICLKKFKKTYNLKQHLLIHANDKPFKCDTCGKAFVQKSNLTKHHLIHKNITNKKLKSDREEIADFQVLTKMGRKIAVEPVKLLQCKNCDFGTVSNTQWKSHQLQVNIVSYLA